MAPDVNSNEFQEALIVQEWGDLAQFAYQEFLRIGRGAILFDLNAIRISTGPGGETNLDFDEYRYSSINNPDFIGQEIHDKILAYDPAKEIVLVFKLRAPRVAKQGDFDMAWTAIYVGSVFDKPTPKEIYESREATERKGS